VIRAVSAVIGSYRSTSSAAACGQPLGVFSQQLPLIRVLGEQPDAVRQLRLGGVHPAHEHRAHEVAHLLLGQPVAVLLGLDQVRDQVVLGVALALLDQVRDVIHELGRGLLERRQHRRDRDRVELLLDQVRPVSELRCVLERRAHDTRDHPSGIRLGECVDEVALAVGGDGVPHLLELLPHQRAQLVRLLRGERVLHELALTAVVIAAQVQQVALHPVPHRALGDALDLEHQDAREVRLLRAHEELDRLVVEHDPADWIGARDPRLLREPQHHLVEAGTGDRLVCVIPLGDVQLCERRHGREL
jgi:hypothetical protein